MRFLFRILIALFISAGTVISSHSFPPILANSEGINVFRGNDKLAQYSDIFGFDEYVGASINELKLAVYVPNTTAVSQRWKDDFTFSNPAGCGDVMLKDRSSDDMVEKVQAQIGDEINLSERRQNYIWNGVQEKMVNVENDPFVYEFIFDSFAPPLTYRGDKIATIFLVNGFTVWFRYYQGHFRITAIPMIEGILDSRWAEYVTEYWEPGGQPSDETIYPVIKKLPCHWVIEEGYVSDETLETMFNFDWSIPDFISDGRQYLTDDCQEAYRISQEEIGFWSATSMCGPLTWQLMKDVNGFPYRIGSWNERFAAFDNANPRMNAQPWASFDPETYDLIRVSLPLAGYDFAYWGDLFVGDVVYSFSSMYYEPDDEHFDHIFLVVGIGVNESRISITNMVENYPVEDCSINEVVLYTPGDRYNGVINHEWNGFGFGKTGGTGFDVFRWKWITYHENGEALPYKVRWGDTIETIAFDWKIDPQDLIQQNQLDEYKGLIPGQIIILPSP